MRQRIGYQMWAAYLYVQKNPGCTKYDVARHIMSDRALVSHRHGYDPVNRAIKCGMIVAERMKVGNGYRLYAALEGAVAPLINGDDDK